MATEGGQISSDPHYTDHASDNPDATTSSPNTLSQALHARRAEFTRPHKIKIKIGSWNVAACPGTEKDLGAWFVDGKGVDETLTGLESPEGTKDENPHEIESVADQEARRSKKASTVPLGDTGTITGGEDVGLYVLGLQEVVELSSATQYIGRVYTDSTPLTKWKNALVSSLPRGYKLVAEQQLSGLLILIAASPTIAPTISSVSSVSVGTGVMGYLGNKGAVATRLVLGETTKLVFINAHLASGTDPAHLERRCWDYNQILSRTKFESITRAGVVDDVEEGIGEEDFAFWFGDLNFRLEGLPGDDIRRLLMLHARGEYDLGAKSLYKMNAEISSDDSPIVVHPVESDDDDDEIPTQSTQSTSDLPDPDDFVQDPHSDPASLQATLDSLLPHDQLKKVQNAKKAFHDGWREGPISFLPTYKYDVGSVGLFDSSDKKRSPSWCDRILFRTRRDKLEYDGKTQEEELARLKDEEMKARGMDHAADDDDVLFDYDPEADGADDDEYDEGADAEVPEEVVTKDGYIDRLQLDVYTSHQRVLSSDHKPLDAVFTLDYDAVVTDLKSKVQQEVARELDRAENEGRPGITIVVEHSHDDVQTSGSPQKSSTDGVEGVDFGEVRYLLRKSRALTIANTGRVPASFSFVERPGEDGETGRIAPQWLTVSFVGSGLDEDERMRQKYEREVTLEPGDTINAILELYIEDFDLVRSLNDGAKLDDVLVLRVVDGRDYFISTRASWLQSCFARSIDDLIRIPEGGVRALLPKDGKMVNRGQPVQWSAPRELFKLTETVETLVERIVAEWQMSESRQVAESNIGWPFDKDAWVLNHDGVRESRRNCVLDALDSDKKLTDSMPSETPTLEKLEVVSEVLLLFLSSISDGIITESLWSKLEADMSSRGNVHLAPEDERAWVLDVLASNPNHNISFVFLISTLSRVIIELTPAKPPPQKSAGSRMSLDIRRSLSFKGRTAPIPPESTQSRRQAVNKKYAEIFAPIIFRSAKGKEKEKKSTEERQRRILEVFLAEREK
jgi:phosphatidylinositol-bisphosphatase